MKSSLRPELRSAFLLCFPGGAEKKQKKRRVSGAQSSGPGPIGPHGWFFRFPLRLSLRCSYPGRLYIGSYFTSRFAPYRPG